MVNKKIVLNIIYILILSSLSHCISSRLKVDNQSLNKFLNNSEAFKKSFTGFSLYDPASEEFLFQYNGDKFFTPASNTKLFSFYTGKKIFSDSIPGIKYTIQNDTLYFEGTGDPTFLDKDFPYQPVFKFFKNNSNVLAYHDKPFYNDRFGPGWSWDDYMYYYSPEKSSMPIFSNVVSMNRIPGQESLTIAPSYFKRSIIHLRDSIFKTSRIENENLFKVYHDQFPDTINSVIPFICSTPLFLRLLSDTLGKPVYPSYQDAPTMHNTLNSQHIDSVMKKMLVVSDNFIAEQILIMGAGQLFDTLDADLCIAFAIDNYFPELTDQIDWVDGSGLSRYNKFTPRSMVTLLQKIYGEYPKASIVELFPNGGVSGTLKNNFRNEIPYIIAKTGSMSNVYNLSGYLITKRGRWLIFSFMNNNFEVSTSLVKSEMEKVLKNIYLKF